MRIYMDCTSAMHLNKIYKYQKLVGLYEGDCLD